MNTIQEIIERIKRLEQELSQELQKKEEEFAYQIRGKKIYFEEVTRKYHKTFTTKVHTYILHADFFNILTAPIIWFGIIPGAFLDLFATVFQAVCFPGYGIPKVRRSDYVVIDRHALSYLNMIEKLNCVYCGYFNGVIAYVQEIAARTEQHWCPIKHARKIKTIHSRYTKFFEYGDGENYRKHVEKIRRDFEGVD